MNAEQNPVHPLPQYRCHKVVQAALIDDILGSDDTDTVDLIVAPEGAKPFVHNVDKEWVERHRPEVGGYLVRYQDGYESYSPAEAFEGGYTKLQEVSPPAGVVRITTHHINPANEKLVIEPLDEPGEGGANHLYQISGFDTSTNPSCPFVARYGKPANHSTVLFQNGPIAESGVNGVTHEALLAILIDRMRGFQSGRFACNHNKRALIHLELAMKNLHERTLERMERGVEGTHQQ